MSCRCSHSPQRSCKHFPRMHLRSRRGYLPPRSCKQLLPPRCSLACSAGTIGAGPILHSSGYRRHCAESLMLASCCQVPICTASVYCKVPICTACWLLQSSHAPHVHSSWPSGLASRAVRLSDNSEESLAKLIAQYSGIACDSIILERLQRPRGGPTKGGTNPCDDSVLACSQAPCATCVLKYHPLLRAAAAGALRQTPLPPSLGFNVRIAWRNALPSVESIISRHNTRHTGQEGGISVCESHGTHKSSLLALATN